MTKQTIEVEGLPEGWKVVAYRVPLENKDYILDGDQVLLCCWPTHKNSLIIEKIQPRRIVLEEISKEEYHRLFHDERCTEIYNLQRSYWKQVKETDIPLTNDEPKLSFSVEECRNVRSLIKDFENLGWFVNPARSLLLQKITEFIKDK